MNDQEYTLHFPEDENLPTEEQAETVAEEEAELDIEDIIAEFHEDSPVEEDFQGPDLPDSEEIAEESSAEPVQESPEEESEEVVEDQIPDPDNEIPPEQELPLENEEIREENIPAGPILFKPRHRSGILRQAIIVGPERRFYELQELGLGKLQLAMLFTFVSFLISAGSTLYYHFGTNTQVYLRLMVFSQIFSLFLAAIFACYRWMDGIDDLFHGRFSPNTLFAFGLAASTADSLLCLKSMMLPFGAAYSLMAFAALWASYDSRNTEMGQTDTLRKAAMLDALVPAADGFEGKPMLKIREAEVSEFTETYQKPSAPEKLQCWICFIVFILSAAAAALGYLRLGLDYALHVFSASIALGFPATAFLSLVRPMNLLERKLHRVGSVYCGWQGISSASQKTVYPITDSELFPIGSLVLNGVKFYGDHSPEQIIGYAAALTEAQESHWDPIFQQLLADRNGNHYHASSFRFYENGGVGGILNDETVLMGSEHFLRDFDIAIPGTPNLEHALFLSIDGKLAAIFALTYRVDRSVAYGLSALCQNRRITPVYVGCDVLINQVFLEQKFKVRGKNIRFLKPDEREALLSKQPQDESAIILTTRNELSARAVPLSSAASLKRNQYAGLYLHAFAGFLGIVSAAALAFIGASDLLTGGTVLLYILLWFLPGFLFTEWMRTA